MVFQFYPSGSWMRPLSTKKVVTRRTQFDKEKAEGTHISWKFLIYLDHIDEVIRIIH